LELIRGARPLAQALKSLEGEISETVPEYQDATEEIR